MLSDVGCGTNTHVQPHSKLSSYRDPTALLCSRSHCVRSRHPWYYHALKSHAKLLRENAPKWFNRHRSLFHLAPSPPFLADADHHYIQRKWLPKPARMRTNLCSGLDLLRRRQRPQLRQSVSELMSLPRRSRPARFVLALQMHQHRLRPRHRRHRPGYLSI